MFALGHYHENARRTNRYPVAVRWLRDTLVFDGKARRHFYIKKLSHFYF